MEKATADGMTMAAVDATLAALGRPEELAQEYVTDELLARAEVSRSPLRILDGLVRWASLSVAGFFVLVASITGYFLGVVFILVAALKPFHPEAAGLWAVRDAAGDSPCHAPAGTGHATIKEQRIFAFSVNEDWAQALHSWFSVRTYTKDVFSCD